jgi:hypothetical protein
MSPTAFPVLPGVEFGVNTRYPSSLFWKFCCFCRRCTEAPNFRPCAPAIFVSLLLNVSSSLCAYMSFAALHMLLMPPPQFGMTPGRYGLPVWNAPFNCDPSPYVDSCIRDGSA